MLQILLVRWIEGFKKDIIKMFFPKLITASLYDYFKLQFENLHKTNHQKINIAIAHQENWCNIILN